MSNIQKILEQASGEETMSLEWLIDAGRAISLENSTKVMIENPGYFKKYIDKISDYFTKVSFKRFFVKTINPGPITTYFERVGFAETRKLDVAVPAGFVGHYLDFLNLVVGVKNEITQLSTTLTSTNRLLATLVGEPDRLEAQTGIDRILGEIHLVDENFLTEIKAFFKPGSSRTLAHFSDVVDNHDDFARSIEACNFLNKEFGHINLPKLEDQIDRAGRLATALNEQLVDSLDSKVSGRTASLLSELFYRLGVTVTSVVVILDTLEQMTKALESTNATLLKHVPKGVAA